MNKTTIKHGESPCRICPKQETCSGTAFLISPMEATAIFVSTAMELDRRVAEGEFPAFKGFCEEKRVPARLGEPMRRELDWFITRAERLGRDYRREGFRLCQVPILDAVAREDRWRGNEAI